MSKYEDFVIMKTYVFLITLGFIQLVFCNHDLNITEYDSYSVCPIRFFRRKRSNAEYTRWRANQDLTTNEFLVKVLDDELTTAHSQKIVAVNIQPLTQGGEKIIIGGAKVPPPTPSLATTDALKDYTRFAVPPTTPLSRREGELFLAAIPSPDATFPVIPPLQPKGINAVRNSQRDDSPPASPQFLARTPMLMGRQYAPIAPVAFNPRTGMAPVKPPSTNTHDQVSESSRLIPTRTTHPYSEIMLPTRTNVDVDEFRKFNSFEEATQPLSLPEIRTRSTYTIPHRTLTTVEMKLINDDEAEIDSTTDQKIFVDGRRREEELKKVAEKDSESSYNMMFYNDEDVSDVNSKKDDQEISDNYFDKKSRRQENKLEDSTEKGSSEKEVEIEYIDPKNSTFFKEFIHIYPEEYGSDNSTAKMSSADVISIPDSDVEIVTLKGLKERLRDKRRPYCNLLKLRQLSFNSPRTLPEITSQLKKWAEVSPMAKWIDISNGNFTTMENPIYMMKIDDPSSGQILSAKQTVMIVAGIQGRDHHAVSAAMYVLYQLIERSQAHSDLLSKFRFWVIPVFNPDGYDYSMTFPHRREWTKNLRQLWDVCKARQSCKTCESQGLQCVIQPCYGVNLDRNFEYQWIPAEELRAEHPCGDLYSGVRQLSELETRALTQYMHEQHTPLDTFIAFKEGEILGIMYPYSHTRKKRAFDRVYRQRASSAAAAAYSINSRPYVAGQTSEFLPLYAGGIEDWVDGHLGIDNTYTVMMFRPSDTYNYKLMTERVVHEAYAAMDTLLLHSLEPRRLAAAVSLKHAGQRSSSVATINPTHLVTVLPLFVLLYG